MQSSIIEMRCLLSFMNRLPADMVPGELFSPRFYCVLFQRTQKSWLSFCTGYLSTPLKISDKTGFQDLDILFPLRASQLQFIACTHNSEASKVRVFNSFSSLSDWVPILLYLSILLFRWARN